MENQFNDSHTEAFKNAILEYWNEADSMFNFAVGCYKRGRIDEARINDPGLNAVISVMENKT